MTAGSILSDSTPEPRESHQEDPKGAENGAESVPEAFSKEYVQELREEAKKAREKAKRVDFFETEVRRLAVREATRGILTDPEALAWDDSFTDEETGLPDAEKIKSAAEALVQAKPYLARPRGDVGQGKHSGEQGISLVSLLRG